MTDAAKPEAVRGVHRMPAWLPADALREAVITFLIALVLFGSLIGLRTDTINNTLEITTHFGKALLMAASVAGVRLAFDLLVWRRLADGETVASLIPAIIPIARTAAGLGLVLGCVLYVFPSLRSNLIAWAGSSFWWLGSIADLVTFACIAAFVVVTAMALIANSAHRFRKVDHPRGRNRCSSRHGFRTRISHCAPRHRDSPAPPHHRRLTALRNRHRDPNPHLHHAWLGPERGRGTRGPARPWLRGVLRGRGLYLRSDINRVRLVVLGLPSACRHARGALGHNARLSCAPPSRRLPRHRDACLRRDHPHRHPELAKPDRRPERHQPHPEARPFSGSRSTRLRIRASTAFSGWSSIPSIASSSFITSSSSLRS